MDEFDLIARYLAPLASSAGAAGLRDDVAEWTPPADKRVIVTTDTLVEGVHFLSSDPLDTVGAKLVAVNVSDIVAKGGRPVSASLALTWPETRPAGDVSAFAAGFGAALNARGISLLGGDTTRTPGPMTLSLTLNGACGTQGPVRRSGARVGDQVWVTGTIGDAGLGLQAALGQIEGPGLENLLAAYRTPQPPAQALAALVAECAHASIDVSDGLVADAGHVAEASSVRLQLRADLVPLSRAARSWLNGAGEAGIVFLATCGDDYQTLFTAPPDTSERVIQASRDASISITQIGSVVEGEGVELTGVDGQALEIEQGGWSHF